MYYIICFIQNEGVKIENEGVDEGVKLEFNWGKMSFNWIMWEMRGMRGVIFFQC